MRTAVIVATESLFVALKRIGVQCTRRFHLSRQSDRNLASFARIERRACARRLTLGEFMRIEEQRITSEGIRAFQLRRDPGASEPRWPLGRLFFPVTTAHLKSAELVRHRIRQRSVRAHREWWSVASEPRWPLGRLFFPLTTAHQNSAELVRHRIRQRSVRGPTRRKCTGAPATSWSPSPW